MSTILTPSKRIQGIRSSENPRLHRQRSKYNTSPITIAAPGFYIEHAMFDVIPSGAITIPSGKSAIFPLKRISIDRESGGQEVSLIGVSGTLLPCDVDGLGSAVSNVADASALPWGDTAGITAAIVVGKNIPGLIDNTWTGLVANLPGIEQNASGTNEREPKVNYLSVFSFPPGKFSDTTPNKSEPRQFFGGANIHRFGIGDSLDVALIVRRAQITGLAAGQLLCGYAHIALVIGETRTQAEQYE